MSDFPGVHFLSKGMQPVKHTYLFSVSHAAFLTIAVLRMIGARIDNEVILRESLEAAYAPLAMLPNAYRLYLRLPNTVPYEALLTAAKGGIVRPVSCWDPLWMAGTEKNSYTAADLDGTEKEPSVRVALRNPKDTGCDPLLHFLNQPFDEKYRRNGQQTQLEALAAYKAVFETENKGYNLTPITARDFLVMMLVDRILGESNDSLILSCGWMCCPELGRRTVAGVSSVGEVCSHDGLVCLQRSDGVANWRGGLGLSAGKNTT